MPPISALLQNTQLRITNVQRETHDTVTLIAEHHLGVETVFAPGQYAMLSADGGREIPISISGDTACRNRLAFTIRGTGTSSTALAARQIGNIISMRGPIGTGWPLDLSAGGDIALIAGGMGLAALRPVIYAIERNRPRYGRLHILIGARSPSDLIYVREFDAWRRFAQVLSTVTERGAGWLGHTGLATDFIDRLPLDPHKTIAMTCGPELMMRSVSRDLALLGVPTDRIFLSTTAARDEGPVVAFSDLPPCKELERLAG